MKKQKQIYVPVSPEAEAIARSTFDVTIQAAIKLAQSYVPFLAAPVIKQFFEFFVRKFMDLLFNASMLQAGNVIIDIKVNRESKEYKDAVISLKEAIRTKTKEEIEIEKENFRNRLRSLISIRN